MRFRKILSFLAATALALAVASPSFAANERRKVEDSADVIKAIMAIPEKGIPPALLRDAYGIAIIPGVIKAGFIVGGRYGTGVLLARDAQGGWSDPAFISLAGGSFGWQIGAASTDIILVLKSRRSIDGVLRGKFTLGVDAQAAAGPVGRSASAATDVTLKSEILSYSRSRGLFAGVSLEGAAITIDDDADASYYGRHDLSVRELLAGQVTKETPETKELKRVLDEYSAAP